MKWLAASCLVFGICAQAQTVLVRDIDKRPLQTVAVNDLSPAAQKAVRALVDDQAASFTDSKTPRAKPVQPEFAVQQIPVAPAGHRLYEVLFTGEFGCMGVGNHCRGVVLDETATGVTTVFDEEASGMDVVRRPNLQMPDLALYEQEGHVGMDTYVYRFDGAAWKPYRCALAKLEDFPPKRVVADRPCKP